MTSITAAGRPAASLERIGLGVGTLGLVLIYFAFGLSKFTPEEATALVGIVKTSPFLGWTYGVVSEGQFSAALGVIELSIGALIAFRPVAPRFAFIGAMLSAGLFLMTQSFLLSTPGVFDASRGLFGFFGGAGQFLLKDTGLFALSLLVAADARAAMARQQ